MKLLLDSTRPPIIPEEVTVLGTRARLFRFNTVVVGSGAAGLNAADTLFAMGQKDIALVTEGLNMGTSRNTGSDKQTYYKLTMAGGAPDSVEEMARTLFAGGSMHGDTALVEAAFSARCFHKLVNIGVPFPHNRYGEYVGYKTDHDPRQRATSCGPLTSRYMTENLERSARERGVPVIDGCRVVAVLAAPDEGGGRKAVGLLALDADATPENGLPPLVLFNCTNIVYATGGPSGLYRDSVYPESQTCATGAALEAGAPGVNLTESQYGLASLKFRWNLSGSYQQVIPAYISTDPDGGDAREFLDAYFSTPREMLDAIFLKGYQWPFDPRKLGRGGSSLVDIAVFLERRKGRRVFLDFRRNPAALEADGGPAWSRLGDEARDYLEKSSATQDKPIERLKAMNPLACRLYLDNGIDLDREPLEASVCAQHNNGGLAVNIWWESPLRHFFPVGEVSGTFGVYRPGGSALNSTQVGSARAAMFIRHNYGEAPMADQEFLAAAGGKVAEVAARIEKIRRPRPGAESPFALRERYQQAMDGCGAFLRPRDGVRKALSECRADLAEFEDRHFAAGTAELVAAFVNRDILLAQFAYLSAIAEYIEKGGRSRGSSLVCESLADLSLDGGAAGAERFAASGMPAALDDGAFSERVCEVELRLAAGGEPSCLFRWLPVRPIPAERDEWFEQVYNAWVEDRVIRP